MPVYFIGEDENGCSPIKIGVAKNIEARQRNLQTGNPLELRLLGWIEATDAFQLNENCTNIFDRSTCVENRSTSSRVTA